MLWHHISVPTAYRRLHTDGQFRLKPSIMQAGAFFVYLIESQDASSSERMAIVASASINLQVAHNWQGKAPTFLRTPRTTNHYLEIPIDDK